MVQYNFLGWWSGVGLILLVACTNSNHSKLPIKGEKLIEVLTDVYLAEAAMQTLTEHVKDSLGQIYYQQLFEIHQITKSDFDKTIQLMESDPVLLDKLYAKVQERIVLLEQKY